MATASHDYSKLSFLIVDDIASFAGSLRTLVQSFGVDDITIVHHGDDAVRALQGKKFDVVLCDFNLGEGKNGQDILEEAKTHGLLKSACIYMMITAENSSDMVRGALEYQPDDYLTKPFTKEVLFTRLQRVLNRNQVFVKVHKAMDLENYEGALEHCDGIIANEPRYKRYAQKLKAQILMHTEQYQEANLLMQAVLMEKPLPWAQLGLGKSYFYLDKIDKAKAEFQRLLDQDRGYVQAWDWLARCQQQQGETEAAVESLQQAVSISPIHVRRQMLLGDMAVELGDTERAERAYGRAVKVGKHSVFRSPESYMKLGDVLLSQLDASEGLVAKRKESKVLEAMDELRTLYRGDKEVQLRSRLMDNQLHSKKGRTQEAEKAIFKAYDLCTEDEEGYLSADLKEQLIESLESLGREDMAAEIITAMQREDSGRNAVAVQFYDKGDLERALQELQEAFKEKPRSYSICLNTAQVAIHYMVKNSRVTRELMELAGAALQRVKDLSEEDRRYKNYQNLRARYARLQQQIKSSGSR